MLKRLLFYLKKYYVKRWIIYFIKFLNMDDVYFIECCLWIHYTTAHEIWDSLMTVAKYDCYCIDSFRNWVNVDPLDTALLKDQRRMNQVSTRTILIVKHLEVWRFIHCSRSQLAITLDIIANITYHRPHPGLIFRVCVNDPHWVRRPEPPANTNPFDSRHDASWLAFHRNRDCS